METRIALFYGKSLQFIQTGGKNFYEIVIFLQPVYRLMHPLALKKVRFLKTHFLPLAQKKIFPYIKKKTGPGLSNNRIRLWFASLTQSILIRYAISALMPICARNEITSDFILSLISLAPAFFSSSVPLHDLIS